jgi:hypothetical protein
MGEDMKSLKQDPDHRSDLMMYLGIDHHLGRNLMDVKSMVAEYVLGKACLHWLVLVGGSE